MKQAQVTLNHQQCRIILEALDKHLDGMSDTDSDWDECNSLLDIFTDWELFTDDDESREYRMEQFREFLAEGVSI